MCTNCRIGHAGLQQMATQKMGRMASNSVAALEATRDGATAACESQSSAAAKHLKGCVRIPIGGS